MKEPEDLGPGTELTVGFPVLEEGTFQTTSLLSRRCFFGESSCFLLVTIPQQGPVEYWLLMWQFGGSYRKSGSIATFQTPILAILNWEKADFPLLEHPVIQQSTYVNRQSPCREHDSGPGPFCKKK